tara:strand:+ start:284 stop:439 length:156 start_codon:yes stop_codon:yes gene_type:complete
MKIASIVILDPLDIYLVKVNCDKIILIHSKFLSRRTSRLNFGLKGAFGENI